MRVQTMEDDVPDIRQKRASVRQSRLDPRVKRAEPFDRPQKEIDGTIKTRGRMEIEDFRRQPAEKLTEYFEDMLSFRKYR